MLPSPRSPSHTPPRGRRSIRLPGYDYRASGSYFVTVCTQGRARILAHVDGGRLRSTEAGRLVWSAWLGLPLHYRHVHVDAFVVMPDHVHGIVWWRGDGGVAGRGVDPRGRGFAAPSGRGVDPPGRGFGPPGGVGAGLRPAPTGLTGSSAVARGPGDDALPPLSEIVRAFKAFSARAINGVRGTPGVPVRQRNYYEHIIRDRHDLARVRAYIRANPARWLAAAERRA